MLPVRRQKYHRKQNGDRLNGRKTNPPSTCEANSIESLVLILRTCRASAW